MDRINIKNLEVIAKHGVLPEERVLSQKFVISVSLYLDLQEAGKSDDLVDTIDYSELCRVIESFVKENSFYLIETVAQGLAEKLLNENTEVKKVWIEVKKPYAPIDATLETVSVEVERSKHTAYIAMGSNIGDREAYLGYALEKMDQTDGCSVIDASDLIETAPYGNTDQGKFLNGCLILETVLTPHELLELLQGIEKKTGRKAGERWGPRTLDLDIVFYDDLVMSDAVLRIPHYDMHNRRFVLEPLCEIAPYILHPVFNKTAAELLGDLKLIVDS